MKEETKRKEKKRIPLISSFDKEIISPGPTLTDRPNDGALCTLSVTDIEIDQTIDLNHSEYLKAISDGSGSGLNELLVTIGEGDCRLDRGLEFSICDMSVEEESRLTLRLQRDNNGDDDDGNPPSGGRISFVIKLSSCKRAPLISDYDVEQLLTLARTHKNRGNELFNASRVEDAFHRFSKAIKYVISVDELLDIPERNELYLALCGNMALCQMHHDNYEYAIDLCNKVLNRSSENIKCLTRRMDCYMKLKDFDRAHQDCLKILQLNAENNYAKKRMSIINQWRAAEDKKYAQMVKQMFVKNS